MFDKISDYAQIFRILSNESRFKILKVLHETGQRISVNSLAKLGKIPLSKISDQLMVLRKYDLVRFEKVGTTVYYYVNPETVPGIIKTYYSLLKLDPEKTTTVSVIIEDPFSRQSFQIYKILANETRCEMLIKLSEKELYVNELCDMFYLEQPTISMHLNYIRKHNLIKCRKLQTKKYYYV